MLVKVVITSKNPVKINAIKIGFKKMFPKFKFKFETISVDSGVTEQPMTDRETYLGATNRVKNAAKEIPKADYWVGIEGGLNEIEKDFETFAWVIIKSINGKIGKAKTGSFFLPKKVIRLVKSGYELGHADDIVFGKNNSKQKNGAVGILTDNVLTRKTFYIPAVIMALIPFKKPKLY